jgi:large subunit ribosomal protein L21
MSRHVARRAFSLATSVAPARAARAATAPSTSRAVDAFAPSSSSPSPSPPLARAFASGLTINGGVTPAVDAVPESIVLVPREEAPARGAAPGGGVGPK